MSPGKPITMSCSHYKRNYNQSADFKPQAALITNPATTLAEAPARRTCYLTVQAQSQVKSRNTCACVCVCA